MHKKSYPFGLAMAGISDKALKPNYAENKYRYNGGTELQNKEFSDGSGLELYDAKARMYDPQIGRFGGIDELSGTTMGLSPYSFCFDDPVLFNDPTGMKAAANNSFIQYTSPWEQMVQDGIVNPHQQEEGWGEEFMSGGGGGGGTIDQNGNLIAPITGNNENGSNNSSDGGDAYSIGSDGYGFEGKYAQNLIKGLQNAMNNADADDNWAFDIGTNKNGNIGYWVLTPIPGAGAQNGMLAEVKFRNDFVSLDGDGGNRFPSFATILSNYPKPYEPGPYPVSVFGANQCAIRVSIALIKSGVDLGGAKNYSNPGGQTYSGKGEILGAYNLAMFLKNDLLGNPESFNGTTQHVPSLINGQTGIIFFQDFIEDGARTDQAVHIDLWNGNNIQAPYYNQMMNSQKIWFWPIK